MGLENRLEEQEISKVIVTIIAYINSNNEKSSGESSKHTVFQNPAKNH